MIDIEKELEKKYELEKAMNYIGAIPEDSFIENKIMADICTFNEISSDITLLEFTENKDNINALSSDVHIQEINPISEQELKVMLSEVEKCSSEEVDLNTWTHMACEPAIETAVHKVESPKKDNLIRCPHCGESYYMENHSMSTAVYYAPIYKDGVNINPDRNTTTTYCTCMNCRKDFSYQR